MNIYKYYSHPKSLDGYEEVLTRVPKIAFEHAEGLGRRFPEAEAAIAKDAQYAYWYATIIIKGRFPEGEAAIANHTLYAFSYAYSIINGRFPEGEASIAKSAQYAYKYARDVIKERFPEGEAAIANSIWKKDYEKQFKAKL
jgi:hypothetical protein